MSQTTTQQRVAMLVISARAHPADQWVGHAMRASERLAEDSGDESWSEVGIFAAGILSTIRLNDVAVAAGYADGVNPVDVIGDMQRRMRVLAESLGACVTVLESLVDSGLIGGADEDRARRAASHALRTIAEAEVRRG